MVEYILTWPSVRNEKLAHLTLLGLRTILIIILILTTKQLAIWVHAKHPSTLIFFVGSHHQRQRRRAQIPPRITRSAWISRQENYDGTMSAPGSQRLWVGPLMLILVIALIYVFSLMPSAPPHRRTIQDYVPDLSGEIRIDRRDEDMAYAPPLEPECMNGGILNETTEACDCTYGFSGVRCQTPSKTICLNDGIYSYRLGYCLCHGSFVGEHCETRCTGGMANRTTNTCECLGRFFGPQCEVLCMHGDIINGTTCKCHHGYMGASCAACDPAVNGEACEHYIKRRGAVNSRLTLSGLSFCMITIGLLCVTARRRRAGMVPPDSSETWYRVFNPTPTRPGRCRHDFMCGGSWFPRDRALIVAPGRATISHGNRRSQQSRSASRRLATPPPSYTSVDNLNTNEEQMPPTYEEATRILSEADRRELIVDETDKEETPPLVPSTSQI